MLTALCPVFIYELPAILVKAGSTKAPVQPAGVLHLSNVAAALVTVVLVRRAERLGHPMKNKKMPRRARGVAVAGTLGAE